MGLFWVGCGECKLSIWHTSLGLYSITPPLRSTEHLNRLFFNMQKVHLSAQHVWIYSCLSLFSIIWSSLINNYSHRKCRLQQARIPSVPYTAFPPGLVLEAEPNWELGSAFPLKKILDRCPDPGSEPAPKPWWSQTREPMTSVDGAYTTDSSLKRRHQTLPDFKVFPITTNSQ